MRADAASGVDRQEADPTGEGPVCTQPRKPPLGSSDGVGLRCGGEGHSWDMTLVVRLNACQ